jgi:Mg2+ and Co2+ transporter CorA
MKNCLFAVLLIVITTSCDKDKVIRTPEEDRILELAYSKDYIYPSSFYHEVNDTGSVYYENTVSIKSITDRDHIWIELNTNDKDEARLWSDKSNEYSSVNREIIDESETDKFFEFKRKNIIHAHDILLSRIHKASYFQPVLNKFSVSDSIIGKYNGELNQTSVKELVEYLWSCGTMDVSYSKVLETELKEYDECFEYYLQSILIVYGDFGMHDEINVYDNFVTLKKSDRNLIVKTNKVKTIQGIQH